MIKYSFSLIIVLLIFSQCKVQTQEEKEQKLVNQYERTIGCYNYFQLKAILSGYDKEVGECEKDFIQGKDDKMYELADANIYKSLTKEVILIHISYRYNNQSGRRAVNYLYHTEEKRIIGYYNC